MGLVTSSSLPELRRFNAGFALARVSVRSQTSLESTSPARTLQQTDARLIVCDGDDKRRMQLQLQLQTHHRTGNHGQYSVQCFCHCIVAELDYFDWAC